jgi:hypothetical protein
MVRVGYMAKFASEVTGAVSIDFGERRGDRVSLRTRNNVRPARAAARRTEAVLELITRHYVRLQLRELVRD